ncbi:hypothetical protein KY084_03290 [Stakelama sp. CBK3Z-3]|uniref:Glycosyltransferase family 4 protein n=1 Tax=Stakelama flava TaxID=2860338 RepID=A0ABS6XI74_9SPHN|nr:glycosyltransferase [Stakelama flava]MBW4329898.1 hypothetical protein [Stakelama flava]
MTGPEVCTHKDMMADQEQGWIPRKVAYFGFDAADASVRRRMRQIGELTDLVGLTFRRTRYNSAYIPEWENVDLGLLRDGHYAERMRVMLGSFGKIMAARDRLRGTELVIARNLDLLALALLARARGLFDAPIVYDVFDVRGILLKNSPQARAFRMAERALIRRCALLVVTSPGFVRHYFGPMLGYAGPSLLVENKVDLDLLPDDPAVCAAWRSPDRARLAPDRDSFVLGWVGALRCARSAEMLAEIARALPWLTVQISGKATYCSTEAFTRTFESIPNIAYTGEYWFPTGLYDVYRTIDLNWDFDLSKHGASGGWLLPNRLYEGGYFGVPHLAETGSETGDYVERLGIGWTVPADASAIIRFLGGVRDHYASVKQRALSVMDDHFQYAGDVRRIFDSVAQSGR